MHKLFSVAMNFNSDALPDRTYKIQSLKINILLVCIKKKKKILKPDQ